MRRVTLLLLFLLMLITGLELLPSQSIQQARAEDESDFYGTEQRAIHKLLSKQLQAWNRHDLEGFMSGYWNSPQLTFFSGAEEHEGWQSTLDRYLATYASPGREMGTLQFSNLKIEVPCQQFAFVRGAWKLTMSHGAPPHGIFTLVLRKFPDGWKIVHDHTSAAE